MPSVADLLSGTTQAPPTAGPPPPPPGFTVSDSPPPPPPGFTVGAPQRTTADMLGMGTRGLMTGAGGLVDLIAAPANATVNAVTGSHLSTTPFRDAANAGADALNLAKPQTGQEHLVNAVVEGGTQGLATAGLAGAAAGAEGTAGAVARSVAAHPVIDTVASAVAGGAQETAAQHGAGPIGQLAAGLVGGVAGVGGARRVADILGGIAERYGSKAAQIVTEVPREAVIDEKGDLTGEGKEVAAQSGLHPDQVKGAYAEAEAAAKAEPAPAEEPASAPPQQEASAPPPEAQAPPTATPEPAAETFAATPEGPLPAGAQARVAEAKSEGVDFAKAQATQDFGDWADQERLRAMQTPEGARARAYFANQQQQIQGAVERFQGAIGDPNLTNVQRGELIKESLSDLKASGKSGVTAMYEQARQLAGSLGDEHSNLIRLDTQPIVDAMRGLMIDETVPAPVRSAIRQQAAQYGLIGGEPRVFEDGTATVKVRDASGEEGPAITLVKPPEPLTILNAEDLRQAINKLYQTDTSHQSQSLKPLIDQAVQQAVDRAASEGTGDVGAAFQAARKAHAAQQQTFKARDVIQQIIDWKKGTSTPVIKPEEVLRTILPEGPKGAESVTDLKKLKAVLLSSPTEKSKAAWAAVKAHAVARIFDKAMVLNAKSAGGELGEISGAKLNSAIHGYGAERLKVLLSQDEFNQLMKLRRIVGNATIEIKNTTNPSGSAWAVLRFLGSQGVKLAGAAVGHIPGVGALAHGASYMAQMGKEAAMAQRTLKDIEAFDPQAVSAKQTPTDYARNFIRVAGSDQMLAPLISSAANEQRPH